ncbi:beta-1,4-glucuronyltransferase 1-like isoform X2 [Neocloeon triangulifer]|uniref:beta-1,4-glucuronyltransferase 1-like isoform X2 n=1 Tax=Neocloeon triangulifer TaxID=2078957 RepID=UPI00286F56FE|nr:beta-1,4-glucuronyltransferase 1-like isoform X2 [Neocloeon triangulifer]
MRASQRSRLLRAVAAGLLLLALATLHHAPLAPRGQTFIQVMLPYWRTRRQAPFSALVDDVSSLNDATLRAEFDKVINLAQFDDSAKYKIVSNFAIANQDFSQEPACVAVQISLNHVSKLLEFVMHWPAAISLSLFAAGTDFYFAVLYIRFLRKCFPRIRNQVTWHLAFPTRMTPNVSDLELLRVDFECSASLDELDKFMAGVPRDYREVARRRRGVKYPQNVLRNVARRGCRSEWVVCPDVDMVFPRSGNTYESLAAFLRKSETNRCQMCAFVFPVYEIENKDHVVPKDKHDLLQFVANNSARQYHIEVFEPNQACSKLKNWEAIARNNSAESTEVRVAYEVKYKFWYEPVYVTKQGSPKFDERYVGYGMTRNTQALEMALSGYRFFLLDNTFLSHLWGFQHKNRSDLARSRQTSHNHRLFCSQHVRELAVRFDSDKFKLLKMQHRYYTQFKIAVQQSTKQINLRFHPDYFNFEDLNNTMDGYDNYVQPAFDGNS